MYKNIIGTHNNEKVETELIARLSVIKETIVKLNKKKNSTNYQYEKKEITDKIQLLEAKMHEIEDYLISKLNSKKVILSKINSYKKDIKEIEYLLDNKKISRKNLANLLNKKLDLNLFISENNFNKPGFDSKNFVYKNSEFNNPVYQKPTYVENKTVDQFKTKLENQDLMDKIQNILNKQNDLIHKCQTNRNNVREIIKEVYIDSNTNKPLDEDTIVKLVNNSGFAFDNPNQIIQEKIVEKQVPIEIVKEIPVEKIKEVPIEVIKEVPVEKIKEVIKEVPVQITKEVEVIKEVPVEKITEVIKEVPVEVIKEVVKEVPVEIVKEIFIDPNTNEPLDEETIVKLVNNSGFAFDNQETIIQEKIVEKEVFIDPNTNKPLDEQTIVKLVNKSGFSFSNKNENIAQNDEFGFDINQDVKAKEIPVEIIKEVFINPKTHKGLSKKDIFKIIENSGFELEDFFGEIDKNNQIEITKEVEVIKEVPVEVIKEVPVEVEVVKEIYLDPNTNKPLDEETIIKLVNNSGFAFDNPNPIVEEKIVEKEVPVEVIKEVEVVKEVPIEIIKEVYIDTVSNKPLDKDTIVKLVKNSGYIFDSESEDKVSKLPEPIEITKEVEVIKEVPVEVVKEVVKEVFIDSNSKEPLDEDTIVRLVNNSGFAFENQNTEPQIIEKKVFLDSNSKEPLDEETIIDLVNNSGFAFDNQKTIVEEKVVEKEVVKEVPVEVIKEVEVTKEVIKEVIVPIEVIKEVKVGIDEISAETNKVEEVAKEDPMDMYKKGAMNLYQDVVNNINDQFSSHPDPFVESVDAQDNIDQPPMFDNFDNTQPMYDDYNNMQTFDNQQYYDDQDMYGDQPIYDDQSMYNNQQYYDGQYYDPNYQYDNNAYYQDNQYYDNQNDMNQQQPDNGQQPNEAQNEYSGAFYGDNLNQNVGPSSYGDTNNSFNNSNPEYDVYDDVDYDEDAIE